MKIIAQLNKIHTCGLSVEITTSQRENFKIIQNHWMKFNAELKRFNLGQKGGDWVKYGITYKVGERYFYMAAIPYSGQSLPDDFVLKEILAGAYVCFVHKGKMEQMKNTLYDIYKNVVPSSELNIEHHSKAWCIHFERYDFRFNWNDSNSIVEIYLPLSTESKPV